MTLTGKMSVNLNIMAVPIVCREDIILVLVTIQMGLPESIGCFILKGTILLIVMGLVWKIMTKLMSQPTLIQNVECW